MVTNRKLSGRASSFPAGIGAGLLTGMSMTLLLSLLTAYLISGEVIGQDRIGYCAMITLLLSSIGGAWTASAKTKRMPVQTSVVYAAGYFLLLVSMTALFFGGQFEAVGVTLVTIVIGSGAGGLLCVRSRKTRKQKHYKI